jgi:hypothetical protein
LRPIFPLSDIFWIEYDAFSVVVFLFSVIFWIEYDVFLVVKFPFSDMFWIEYDVFSDAIFVSFLNFNVDEVLSYLCSFDLFS